MVMIHEQKVEVVGCGEIEQVMLECSCLGTVFAHAVAAPKKERNLTDDHWRQLVRFLESHDGEDHCVSVVAKLHKVTGMLGLVKAMSDETDTRVW